MNTELLSVVDENDLVIDTQARHIIHASGLRHRAVHILVFNQQGELFLQKNQNIHIERGADNTGNLYNPENYKYCLKKHGNSMHFITGDGGSDFTINYNHQESLALRLILTQVAYAVGMQAKGGTFVLKMFDLFSKASIDILTTECSSKTLLFYRWSVCRP